MNFLKKLRFKIHRRSKLLTNYMKSRSWILNNTFNNEGIIVVKRKDGAFNKPYPEVSGYYIPSLLNWGFRDLAKQYASWLISIQHKNGAWYDYDDKDPYVFDSGQILKGLVAIYPLMPEIEENIIKGCDWIITNIDKEGRLLSPSNDCWAIPSCSDLIHLYSLSPIKEAGILFNRKDYLDAVEKVLNYYKTNYLEKIKDFHTLSHFYAYIIEAMVDLGETDIARQAMKNVAKLQSKNGAVPAYKDVKWVCSTGLFQFAVIWYKLGEKEKADRAFDYACSLQLNSGGWLGSYGKGADYSHKEEISWANKYFLDALSWKIKSHFKSTAENEISNKKGTYALVDEISQKDGRLQFVLDTIGEKKPQKILDIGCGFGRILKAVKNKFPDSDVYGVDISKDITEKLPKEIKGFEGSLLKLPFDDSVFDFVTTTEALEHSVDIENAVKEMIRVTKPGGHILVIDKNIKCWGMFETPEWEQWFDIDRLTKMFVEEGFQVSITKNIPYDDNDGKNGLFFRLLGKKVS